MAEQTGIPSWVLTLIGFVLAVLGFFSANMPADTPEWARLLVGAVLAGATAVGFYSHPGTGTRASE